jgi:hypothetical protein
VFQRTMIQTPSIHAFHTPSIARLPQCVQSYLLISNKAITSERGTSSPFCQPQRIPFMEPPLIVMRYGSFAAFLPLAHSTQGVSNDRTNDSSE